MLSCFRVQNSLCIWRGLLNYKIFAQPGVSALGSSLSTQKIKFHVCSRFQVSVSPGCLKKYNNDDDDEVKEDIKYVLVKAPPGAADTSVPGKLEWEKTVGSRVFPGSVVCRIRFKDGRTLDIPSPSGGVIAVRRKNEGDPVQHSEELFKIRLDPTDHFPKKKKRIRKLFEFDEEEAERRLADDVEHVKPSLKSSYIMIRDQNGHPAGVNGQSDELQSGNPSEPTAEATSRTIKSYPRKIKYPTSPNNFSKRFEAPLHGINASVMTSMDEINMQAVLTFFEKQDRVLFPARPSFRSIYVKAAAFVLKMNPTINIRVLNNEPIQKKDIDITLGFRYLKVMVFHTFKNVDTLPYMDITRILQEIKKQVAEGTYKAGKAEFDFTISQEWERGSVFGTPQYSKTCTLGIHKILTRPVVTENKIAAYPMLYVSLTYNNSMIPDEDAIRFLRMFKNVIEEPRYILINSV